MAVDVAPSAGSFTGVPAAAILPFVLLLLLIAAMPLTPPRLKHFWERWYPVIAIGLGWAVILYYLGWIPAGGRQVLTTLEDYFAFIALIGSLYVVAGGIHIEIRGEARPLGNVLFLLIGALLANLVGTTGASMVLIRPWIRLNRYRMTAFHVVFFIFVVSNIGGALTPIGDPPLFLGYLHGVPFFWLFGYATLPWLFTLGLVLGAFYVLDTRNFLRAPRRVREFETRNEPVVRVAGLHNLVFLLAIVGGVFLPERFFFRQCAMLAAAAAAFLTTRSTIRAANEFSFGPIKEVAFLFAGIFATMMPALDYLQENGRSFGIQKPAQYYLASGALSSVLDNAPTYLNFLTLAEASVVPDNIGRLANGRPAPESAVIHWMLNRENLVGGAPAPVFIVAVSLGSVFFGAMTYIGNGPNFMVKSIAESAKVRTPTFLGYLLKFSLPLLLPILLLAGWIFL